MLLLAIGLWFFTRPDSEWDAEYFDYGMPTPLASDAPLYEPFCAIHRDFYALPDVLIAEHQQFSSWTERRLGAGTFNYGPVRQLVLSDAALEFVHSHSRAELVAALAPIMASPDGGRAAVILAGLPSRSKAALSNNTALAEEMDRLYRHDRTARTPLDNRAMRQGPPLLLYSGMNMGRRLERPVRRSRSGTFEARLEAIFDARSRLPMSVIDAPVVEQGSPFRGKRSSLAAVTEAFPPPEAAAGLIEFVDAFSREELLIALFPYVAGAQPGSKDLTVLIWASGLQDTHWPLASSTPALEEGVVDELRNRWAAELLALCE